MRVKRDEEDATKSIKKYKEKKLTSNHKDYANRVRSLERELFNEKRTIKVHE